MFLCLLKLNYKCVKFHIHIYLNTHTHTHTHTHMYYRKDLIAGSVVKNPPANAGDTGDLVLIPRSGRSPGGGNPLQYSCLENPMDRGA